MVKLNTSANNQKGITKTKDERNAIIEERPSILPGKARFSRKPVEVVADTQTHHDQSSEVEFCQQLLVDGYVQSYVDFYHLTHRADPNTPEGRVSVKIEVSQEDMIFIKDNLVKAEVSRRQGITSGVYKAYNNLAEYYKKSMDWRTAIYFHEKCLEVSQLTSDLRAEMTANHALGTVYQKMGDWEMAKGYHERHEEVAYSVDILEEVAKANIELHHVYNFLAEKLENEKDLDGALDMYEKCVESAKKCWDKSSEGEANGKIGHLLMRRGDAVASLPYLQNHSQIASDLGDAEGRCRACSALAWAYDSLGDEEKALAELTLVHSISEQAGDAFLQAQACRSLGTLYSKVGKLDDAVLALEKHFDLYRVISSRPPQGSAGGTGVGGLLRNRQGKNRPGGGSQSGMPVVKAEELDLARVYVGISKGNQIMGSYVLAIESDLSSLLDWKLTRTEMPVTMFDFPTGRSDSRFQEDVVASDLDFEIK